MRTVIPTKPDKKFQLPKVMGPKRKFYTIEPPTSDPDRSVLTAMMSEEELAAAKKEFPELVIREATPGEVAETVAQAGICEEE